MNLLKVRNCLNLFIGYTIMVLSLKLFCMHNYYNYTNLGNKINNAFQKQIYVLEISHLSLYIFHY